MNVRISLGYKIPVKKQLGSILVVSVIMLAVLAGLCVAVLSSSVTEKKLPPMNKIWVWHKNLPTVQQRKLDAM